MTNYLYIVFMVIGFIGAGLFSGWLFCFNISNPGQQRVITPLAYDTLPDAGQKYL
jgi:hypothetical protein